MPSILSSEFWINKGGEEHLLSASHNNALYFSLLQMIFKLGCKSFEGQFQWRGKTMITSEYPPIASAWSTLTSLTSSWCSRQARQKFLGVVENFLKNYLCKQKFSKSFKTQSVPQSLVFASIVCISYSFCSFSSISPQTLNSSWKLNSILKNVKGTYAVAHFGVFELLRSPGVQGSLVDTLTGCLCRRVPTLWGFPPGQMSSSS